MNFTKPNPLAEDYEDPRKFGKTASELQHFASMAKATKSDNETLTPLLSQEQVDELCQDYKQEEFWMTEDRTVFWTEDDARAYTESHFGDLSFQHFKKTIA